MRGGGFRWSAAPRRRRGRPEAREIAPLGLGPADAPRPPSFEVVPPLSPRDEVVFLLHTAAEVEHSLLVQYLYAWMSASHDWPEGAGTIRTIAIQEMAHLATVQNVLRALSAPLNFDREDYPFRGDFYPFPFALEPVSSASLARYVVAEMPEIPDWTDAERDAVYADAKVGTSVDMFNRVGALYAGLIDRIARLSADEFLPPSKDRQADESWARFDPSNLVAVIDSRLAAIDALTAIARQGEGLSGATSDPTSHFAQFLDLWRSRKQAGSPAPVGPFPSHPSTGASKLKDASLEQGRITADRALAWAGLSNHRYRMLLAALACHLEAGPAETIATTGAPTPTRGILFDFTFDLMFELGGLAAVLSTLPLKVGDPDTGPKAGPPFELPYTLAVPDTALGRWRLQRDLVATSTVLVGAARRLEPTGSPHLGVLQAIDDADAARVRDYLQFDPS